MPYVWYIEKIIIFIPVPDLNPIMGIAVEINYFLRLSDVIISLRESFSVSFSTYDTLVYWYCYIITVI